MTLVHQSWLIGDNFTLSECLPNSIYNNMQLFGLFGSIIGLNNFFNKYKMSLECVCNVSRIDEKVYSEYPEFRKNKYAVSGFGKPLGMGNYFHFINDNKFAVVSHDDIMVDYYPMFNINHPVKKLLPELSKSFGEEYKNEQGFCDFSKFNHERFLLDFNADNFFKVNLVGIFGHIHKFYKNEPLQLNVNKESEIYLKKNFFVQDHKMISNFTGVFRDFNQNNLEPEYQSGFDYSHVIVRHGKNYYFYAEATHLGPSYEKEGVTMNHHDRFGFILELLPASKGVSNSKISLVSYIETLNNLLKFESQKDFFNGEKFIEEFGSNLESVFK